MEKLMTKKNVLKSSLAYVVYFVGLFFVSISCESSWCRVHDDDPLGILLFVFMPLLPMFFLSLITYKMKDEVFRAWFWFALWFVPIIMIVTFLLNRTEQNGMGISGAVSDAFNFLIICIFYIIFIVVSLIRIALAYKRTR